MFIYKKCHNIDAKAIDCDKAHSDHQMVYRGPCSICGKQSSLRWCYKYPITKEDRGKL